MYPEVGLSFQRILHTAGIAAVTKVSEMPLHYFPFDKDLLCMHRPEVVKELLTDSNPAILSETARVRADFSTAVLLLAVFSNPLLLSCHPLASIAAVPVIYVLHMTF